MRKAGPTGYENPPARELHVAMVSRRVHPAHGPGGLEQHVYDLVRHLAQAGVRVDLYAETPADPVRATAAAAVFPSGVALHWVPGKWLPLERRGTVVLDRITNYPAWSRRVGRWITERFDHRPPDLVHVHGLAGLGAARERLAGRLTVPLLLTAHGMEEFQAPGRLKHLAYAPFRRWMRTVAQASECVVATDECLVDLVGALLNVESDRLVVLPNAIDPELCRTVADTAAARRFLGEHVGGSPILISVGRLAPNKGFDRLAEALGIVASSLPAGWFWVLVGEGPYRKEIEAAVARAGIGTRCLLAGEIPAQLLHGLLAIADWLVHPTLYEGSSLVTLEGMAHALPVLATRTGGLPDKVSHHETGLLVEPDRVDALAKALAEIPFLDSVALGSAGLELLEQRFSWKVLTAGYVSLYRRLVGRATSA